MHTDTISLHIEPNPPVFDLKRLAVLKAHELHLSSILRTTDLGKKRTILSEFRVNLLLLA